MKDFFTYVLIFALGGVLIVLGVIFSKHPGIGVSPTPYMPASNTTERTGSTLNPNYENTGIFNCGPVDFSANIPSKYLELGISEDANGKLFEWKSPLLPESNTWIVMWCASVRGYKALVSNEDKEERIGNFKLADILNDGEYVVMVDNTVKQEDIHTGDIYKLDFVLKKNPNLKDSKAAEYIYLKSKSSTDEAADRLTSIILILYAYTYDQETIGRFNTMVNSVTIKK